MKYFHKKKLIFGTAENLSYETLEYVLRKNLLYFHLIMHHSQNFQNCTEKNNFKNDIILKFKSQNLEQFKKNENYFKLFNTDTLFAVQISSDFIFRKL